MTLPPARSAFLSVMEARGLVHQITDREGLDDAARAGTLSGYIGCEYMTGGAVAILGPIGANFAAGMTGGVVFIHDPAGVAVQKINHESVLTHFLDVIGETPHGGADQQAAAAPALEFADASHPQESIRGVEPRPIPVVDGAGREGQPRSGHGDDALATRLHGLLTRHAVKTGSSAAARLLANWPEAAADFLVVRPK